MCWSYRTCIDSEVSLEPSFCPLETPEGVGDGGRLWSPVPVGSGPDFYHGFLLWGIFYNVPVMTTETVIKEVS